LRSWRHRLFHQTNRTSHCSSPGRQMSPPQRVAADDAIVGPSPLRGLHLLAASSLLALLTPMLPQRRIAYAQGYLALGMVAEAAAELGQLTPLDAQRPEALAVARRRRSASSTARSSWPRSTAKPRRAGS
jgi:hypothetical protein